ncbi:MULTISPECIES: (deoxy)nucleoside triphosphate pyrophosphohydrolase [unclassified Butyrivibrio]|uniref:(deoxy)nucleoside triphosphate pyrophosphohydrolase n=1 Tax=unclassified Butyrivibrio TaxID=2639466 RepID=UPI0008863724|nr:MULTISPECIES: (deoxy)nucleoside triphosphate pyrophosphohydrolase [unclassified Butyrivibrio]SDB67868.1 8-oxo-dGTP diphosphatase [Butyrivibrio sp. INlla16]SEM12048.1 8-oxo-dGTP diphosphatase [Butyrivibrio sp. ob235]
MKTVNVVAAVICDDYKNKTKIFATQRGYGDFKDGWEFPGGKIEDGETPEDALIREIKEELATDIEVHDLISIVDYDYPTFHLHMHCFFATVKSGELSLLEHEAAKWVTKDDIDTLDWLPADEGLIQEIKKYI